MSKQSRKSPLNSGAGGGGGGVGGSIVSKLVLTYKVRTNSL